MYDAGSFHPSGSSVAARLRSLERHANFVSRDIAQYLEQIAGIESNIELIPGVSNRKLVLGLTKIRCLHAELEHASVERQAEFGASDQKQ